MSRLETVEATRYRDVCDYMFNEEHSEPSRAQLAHMPCTGDCDLCFANYPIDDMVWNLTYE